MIPQVDLLSFVFWRKLKALKNISKLTDLKIVCDKKTNIDTNTEKYCNILVRY